MRLLLIGRSAHADVVIPDPSVSAFHAEVVATEDGRFYLTDRASDQGTYHRRSDADSWASVRQAFVERSDQLRLGDYVCHVADLLDLALVRKPAGQGESSSGATAMQAGEALRDRPRGAVERDPITGEIVRRRF